MKRGMKRNIAVVTSSRADYSHLYWPLRELSQHPDVDLKLIVLGAHLSPQFGETVGEIEKDGFPIAARLECLRQGQVLRIVAQEPAPHSNYRVRAIVYEEPRPPVACCRKCDWTARQRS